MYIPYHYDQNGYPVIIDQPDLPEEISITWHIDDVMEVREDLSEYQARQVLKRIKDTHDACIGVNWDLIKCVADLMYPEQI